MVPSVETLGYCQKIVISACPMHDLVAALEVGTERLSRKSMDDRRVVSLSL